ncbi:MAG: protein kinase [Deltaproteobacteria bacterium]|nr:protein kinase [Deltaproteobacteria bacterium]
MTEERALVKTGDIIDGRYRLLELLGEGAAGKVFRAEDQGHNHRFVALKILHATDPRWEGFFRREFEVLSRLRHPNLVRVYDYGPLTETNSWYFTQELVVGKPVLDVIYGKKVDEVAAIFIEICRALEFIHAHGVLHRDLKPANILVQVNAAPGERARVLDFGLWRELDTCPQRGARWAGTPPYLASEVLRGYGHSISADLYAVGVTLFQAVTRKLPHGRGTPQELLANRKKPAPDLTGIVAKPLAETIARLLDEESSRRPQSSAEVIAGLAHLVPGHALAMPITLGRARMVGRDAQRDAIVEIFEAVNAGKQDVPRLLVVEGEDGFGKSRMVSELKAAVQLLGGRSALGHCVDDERWSFRPVTSIVRSLTPSARLSELSPRVKEAVLRLCPDLADGEEEGSLATPLVGTQKQRFHSSILELVLTSAKERLTVILVEDIPWCDAPSLGILKMLLQQMHGTKLVMLVTAGPKEVYGELPVELLNAAPKRHVERPAKAGRKQLPAVKRFQLGPLTKMDVERLTSALLGLQKSPNHLVDSVFAHSRGSPLLIEELLALYIERGDLKRGESGWRVDDFKSASTGSPRLSVLAERLGRLNETEKCTLSALAIFNRPAGPKILAAISGLELPEVRESLSSAEAAGLTRVVGEEGGGKPRVVFRHPQIRDVLIDELRDGKVLAEWHQTCAEALAERIQERGQESPMAETLAFHFDAAGDVKNARRWLIVAAEYALEQFLFPEAAQLARRGIKFAEAENELEEQLHCEVLFGKALFLDGNLEEARSFLEGVVRRGKGKDWPDLYASLHVWLSRACNLMGSTQNGRRVVNAALDVIDEEKHPLAHARLLISRCELDQRSHPQSARKDGKQALREMPKPRPVDDELAAFEALTVAAFYAGERKEATEFARHRLLLAEKEKRPLQRVSALRHLAQAKSTTGDRLEARTHLNEALKLATEMGLRGEEALLTKALGEQLFISGAIRQSLTRFQEAASMSAELGQRGDRADALKLCGLAYFSKGDYTRAIDHLESALSGFKGTGHLANTIVTSSHLTNAFLASGDDKKAEENLAAAEKLISDNEMKPARQSHLLAKANCLAGKNDFAGARKNYLRSAHLARQGTDPLALGEVLVGYSQLLLRHGKIARSGRMARHAEIIFIGLDAKRQLKRLQPLLNATFGLVSKTAGAPQ